MMKRIMRNAYYIIMSVVCIICSYFIKRNEHYIVFGNWFGNLYNDNSKYLAQFISNNFPTYKIIWVGKKCIKSSLPSEYIFVKFNSLTSIKYLLRAKYMFFTQLHRMDISYINVFRGAKLCLLDHGVPIKKWGLDAIGTKVNCKKKFFLLHFIYWILGENQKYDYIIVSSKKGESQYSSAMSYKMDRKSLLLPTGTPRNDFILNTTVFERKQIKDRIAKKYGFDASKKIISYLPTFRRLVKQNFSFCNLDDVNKEKLEKLLIEHNAILLEKNHFVASRWEENDIAKKINSDSVIKIDQNIDFQELLLITDIQIADYSGGYLDYLLLNRPIIQFIYDYYDYCNKDTGIYYTKEEFVGGKECYTFEEVLHELELLLNGVDLYVDKRRSVRNSILEYEQGDACQKICSYILGK